MRCHWRKFIFSVLTIFFGGLIIFSGIHAYNDTDTHPDLTVEIAEFYNFSNPENPLSEKEIQWMRRGSIEEDTPPRWINHFYNPETKTGWEAKNLGDIPQPVLKTFSSLALSKEEPASSLEWARNQELQNKYRLYKGNHTWERAIYDFVAGDKQRAFESLGYVLHLIEDTSVPDHTRSDTHAEIMGTNDKGSPYEKWALEHTLSNDLKIAENLFAENKKPYEYPDFDEFLIKLAEYSHYNFFSEDTIVQFDQPQVDKFIIDNDGYKRGYDMSGFILVYADLDNKLSIDNFDILSSYWSRLSREAILTGAGVVELFFKETEKAKENQNLLKPPPDESIVGVLKGTVFSAAGEGFRAKNFAEFASGSIASYVQKVGEVITNAAGAVKDFIQGSVESSQTSQPVQTSELPNAVSASVNTISTANTTLGLNPNLNPDIVEFTENSSRLENGYQEDAGETAEAVKTVEATEAADTIQTAEITTAKTAESKISSAANSAPVPDLNNSSSGSGAGFSAMFAAPAGAGGGTAISSNQEPQENSAGQSSDEDENTSENGPTDDTTAPEPPIVISPFDFTQIFISSSVDFLGTAEASSTLLAEIFSEAESATTTATTTASSSGNWSISLNFEQATSTIYFKSQDQAGNISSSTPKILFVDSAPPLLSSFSITECGDSLIPTTQGCLVATTTLNLVWTSSDSDIDYYELQIISTTTVVSTTTVNSIVLNLADNSSYNFSLRARDIAGNWSETTSSSAEINIMPVVINEVAWAGTNADHYNDEWIEFYNRTERDIDLSGWRLTSSDASGPNIVFSADNNTITATIPAKGFYLIERTDDDNTVSDIAADWKGSFGNGLDNGGEILTLSRASTTIDQTVLCVGGPYKWCPGFDYKYRTMERIDPDVAGTDSSNWHYNNMKIRNGKDASGITPINGTPKARNSASYLIAIGPTLSQNKTLFASSSPYFVPSSLAVAGGATLTIEPGVVIKLYSDSMLNISGTVRAEGASSSPIVFTSFYDDEYGGDINGDGICNPSDASSTALCPAPGQWHHIGVSSSNNDSSFSYVRFRYGGQYYSGASTAGRGMVKVTNTSATFSNAVFEYSKVYGLDLNNSNSSVENSEFRFNNADFLASGLYIHGGGSPAVSGNIFSENKVGIKIESVSANIEANTFLSQSADAIRSVNSPLSSFLNNSGSGNAIGGVVLEGAITAVDSGTTTLKANTLPYVVYGYPVTVSASSTLNVEKNVIIKGRENSGFYIHGTIFSNEESADDIIFTSMSDDSVGGDTNNDGGATSPFSGYWRGIVVFSGGEARMKGFTIRYAGGPRGGGDDKAGLNLVGGRAYISQAVFDKNYLHSVRASNALANLNDAILKDVNETTPSNTVSSLILYNSSAALEDVIFSGNLLGVRKDAQSTISAVNVSFINNTATSSPPDLFP